MTPPRDVPSWDEFYLGLAYQYAGRSKDPSTQVGAVVVDPHYIPLGFGCNGAPRQIPDNKIDWSRPHKYHFVKHAESNSIDHCARHIGVNGLDDCILYVTGHPCSGCMLRVVSKGIKRICYGPLNIVMVDEEEIEKAKQIADEANVLVEKFDGNLLWMLKRMKLMHGLGLFGKKNEN